ncbi:MAG: L,D-transpeptidase family protein [Hyphomicrobium sp.]
MLKFVKSDVGAATGRPRVSTLALLAAGLLVAAAPERAEAQFYQWGMWGNSGPQKPRRARRAAPRYVEPNEDKAASTLPKPSGPLVIVVSINNQTVTVYDDGKVIAKSPISSGMTGHPTPTGVFSILEKNRIHHSNLYGGAPMPFMQRVTNSGVAMHAGDLPGYPASHGCIRLPYSFARNLFGITDVGARVIISDDDLTPAEFNSPHLIAPLAPDGTADSGSGAVRAAASGDQAVISNVAATPSANGERTRGIGSSSSGRRAQPSCRRHRGLGDGEARSRRPGQGRHIGRQRCQGDDPHRAQGGGAARRVEPQGGEGRQRSRRRLHRAHREDVEGRYRQARCRDAREDDRRRGR